MAQWDVYINPNHRARDDVPYLVVLQSDLLGALPLGLVARLARTSQGADGLSRRLTPRLSVQGEEVILRPHQAGVVDAKALKQPLQSLRANAHQITDALDAVIGGI